VRTKGSHPDLIARGGIHSRPLRFGTGDKARRWRRDTIEHIAREGLQPLPE
jgi:hypothetical protein